MTGEHNHLSLLRAPHYHKTMPKPIFPNRARATRHFPNVANALISVPVTISLILIACTSFAQPSRQHQSVMEHACRNEPHLQECMLSVRNSFEQHRGLYFPLTCLETHEYNLFRSVVQSCRAAYSTNLLRFDDCLWQWWSQYGRVSTQEWVDVAPSESHVFTRFVVREPGVRGRVFRRNAGFGYEEFLGWRSQNSPYDMTGLHVLLPIASGDQCFLSNAVSQTLRVFPPFRNHGVTHVGKSQRLETPLGTAWYQTFRSSPRRCFVFRLTPDTLGATKSDLMGRIQPGSVLTGFHCSKTNADPSSVQVGSVIGELFAGDSFETMFVDLAREVLSGSLPPSFALAPFEVEDLPISLATAEFITASFGNALRRELDVAQRMGRHKDVRFIRIDHLMRIFDQHAVFRPNGCDLTNVWKKAQFDGQIFGRIFDRQGTIEIQYELIDIGSPGSKYVRSFEPRVLFVDAATDRKMVRSNVSATAKKMAACDWKAITGKEPKGSIPGNGSSP